MSWEAMTQLFFLCNVRITLKSNTASLTNSKNLLFHTFAENYLSPLRKQQAIRILEHWLPDMNKRSHIA